uniref:NADH-ubiquinone oxidoreductase chain 5 n=3 Tax=Anthoceros TaxID=3233 RepID=A0A6M8AYF6_ANTPU|nr:NADH dehydrogenase subunit 5 [Anthoceros punctatus]YP_009863198.1 NADH dehydrogenase subunit 5 [Anthoceros agrestis]QKD76612.1 NADH dehydrogenase subunit 5 [Anthoceros punctatus]QKD76654.1 NADH dehydrogenase subunit 5 [Anthoceros agrestis]
MYLLIVTLPLPGSFVAGAFGRFLGSRGTATITTMCVSLSFPFPLIAFYEVALGASVRYIKIASWIFSEMFDASRGFLFDSSTVVMLIVVTFVSSLVYLYSISYMSEDPHSLRFMCYLFISISFTPMPVTGDNFIQLFLGWEGVGPALYSSINSWFTRLQANKAAIKAMPVNRVGDFGSALGIMGVFTPPQTVDFSTIFACASVFSEPNHFFVFCNMRFHAITVIRILLFIGAAGKFAQIGLHTRLPDVMEGLTPVSASIYVATMVTAGVFMIARCPPSYENSPNALIVITFVGAMTSFFAATTGILQNDLKRVIAYLICSQSGYMIFACGISNYSVSVYHLMNYAFLKALLPLSAGSVIHAMSDEQDMRKMGGLASLLPFTYAMMLIGSLSLIGFPFLTGFHPKDVIPELAYTKYTISGNFAFWLGSVSVFLSAYHSFRLLFLTFLAPTNSFKRDILGCHDAPILMAILLICLAFGSIFVGYLAKDMMIGLGTNFWANFLFISPQNEILAESEFATPTTIKLIPIMFSTLGAFVAYNVNFLANELIFALKTTSSGNGLYCFLNKCRFFDKVFNDFIVRSLPRFGYEVSFKASDKGAIEILGPYGISYTFRELAKQISKLQSGFVYHYAFAMSIGLTIFITIIGLRDFLSFWVDNRLYFIYTVTFLFLNLEGDISTN